MAGLGGEEELWSASFDDARTFAAPEEEGGHGWRVEREESGAWRLEGDALKLGVLAGGIFGDVFGPAKAARNLLLRPMPAECRAVEVAVALPAACGSYGEQAGVFWRADDNNYVKLVIEALGADGDADGDGDGDGAGGGGGARHMAVLVVEHEGRPLVVGKMELAALPAAAVDAAAAPDTEAVLRLELSADGRRVSGAVVTPYCLRLVGNAETPAALLLPLSGGSGGSDDGGGGDGVGGDIGVSAHGADEEDGAELRFATVSALRLISLAADRVRLGMPAMAPAPAPAAGAAAGAAEAAAPAAASSSWRFSDSLSAEQRADVMAMLGTAGGGGGAMAAAAAGAAAPPTLLGGTIGEDRGGAATSMASALGYPEEGAPVATDAPPGLEGWVFSASLSEDQRAAMEGMLLQAQTDEDGQVLEGPLSSSEAHDADSG